MAGDGGAESAELESVLVEVGIACIGDRALALRRELAGRIPQSDVKMTAMDGGELR